MKTLFVATLSCLLASCLASCASVQATNDSAIDLVASGADVTRSVNCNRCTDFRRLVIVNRPSGQREVYYAKHGSAEKLANGDANSCKAVFDRMSIDLESSGSGCL